MQTVLGDDRTVWISEQNTSHVPGKDTVNGTNAGSVWDGTWEDTLV